MAKNKLLAPAKSPRGGTGGMRVDKSGQSKDALFGPAASEAPGPAELASSETYGESSESGNGSESDAGLLKEARGGRNHVGRGFGPTLMKGHKG